MSEFSLVPERQLVFSPGLAATIGLEEAILAQHLQQLFDAGVPQLREGCAWLRVERDYLQRTLPFWSAGDLQRIVGSLADKGVLLVQSGPLHSTDHLLFAFNRGPQGSRPAQAEPPPPAARRGAQRLPADWSPSEDMLQLLGLNHNIPREFALQQLEDFILYWQERGEAAHAWENKFRQHVLGRWRRHQQQAAEAFEVPEALPLDRYWRPSADALEILERGGIERGFVESAIPEFVLYWRERGAPKEINSRFVQHVRLQWHRVSNSLGQRGEPSPIEADWYPCEDVFDILQMSHIDLEFARNLLPEFIVYWRDSGQAHASWNTKFLQHVKHQWARRHQMEQTGRQHGGHQGADFAGRTRDRSIEQDLTDTSWAD